MNLFIECCVSDGENNAMRAENVPVEKEPVSLDEIKRWNNTQLLSMLSLHTENLALVQSFDDGIFSTTPSCVLLDARAQLFPVYSVVCKDYLSMYKAYGDVGSLVLYLFSAMVDQPSPIPIAQRDYNLFHSSKNIHKLIVSSSLEVDHSYSRIGIGSSLLDMDDQFYEFIVRLFVSEVSLRKIEARVTDGTWLEDKYWTTRRFSTDMKRDQGWVARGRGKFRRTLYEKKRRIPNLSLFSNFLWSVRTKIEDLR